MKLKQIKELRKLSEKELIKELKIAREAALKLRFQKVVDEVTDTSQIKKSKIKIAQIKTLLSERKSQE